MMTLTKKTRSAFSLIEVSVVIIIVGIFVAGILVSDGLITKFRISAAQSLSRSSPINEIPDAALWLESSLDDSFNSSESSNNTPLTTWYDHRNSTSKVTLQAVSGGPTYSNTINRVHAVKFSGSGGYFTFDGSFLNNSDYTISFLEKRESASADNYLLGDSASSASVNQQLLLGYSQDGQIIHSQGSGNSYNSFVSSYTNSSANPKIITFVQSAATGKKTYINGVLAAQNSNATQLSGITTLSLGKGYTGQIGEIAIFARALEIDEIKAIETYMGKKWSTKMDANPASSCIGGIVTSKGCVMDCAVSLVGSSTTQVTDGSTGTINCNSSGFTGALNYSCSGGVLAISSSPATCQCASGYTLVGSSCQQFPCAVSIVGVSTTSVTAPSGSLTCDVSGYGGSVTYTCAAGTLTPSGSCNVVLADCTGGTVDSSSVSGATIHTFTSGGTFTCPTARNIELLLIAGGGGGGGGGGWGSGGGGGGAGGLIYKSVYSVTTSGISVTVGSGGAGGSYSSGSLAGGTNGTNSTFGSLTSIGGGGGGGRDINGALGGSGGGDGTGSSTSGAGTSGQGNAGSDNSSTGGGGGGGGGSAGSGLNGGNGLQYAITGANTYYSGGGAGRTNGGTQGTAGLGGGGAVGTAGSSGKGGGGGGASSNTVNGAAGGSGIAIIRYFTGNAPASSNPSIQCSVSGIPGITDSTTLGYSTTPNALPCGNGYSGIVSYTCSANGPATMIGSCTPTVCSISGVTGVSNASNLSYSTSPVSLTCNTGYVGTPSYTCTDTGPATVSGSCTAITCSITSINGLTDTTGIAYTSSAVSLPCGGSYIGSVTYTCTAIGAASITGTCSPAGAYSLCTGGTRDTTQTNSSGPTIHTFTSGGTFTCPAGRNVEVLVVAGGGGGGGGGGWGNGGGGGGGGGVVYSSSFAVSTSGISIIVGSGGAGGSSGASGTGSTAVGTNGTNSSFTGLTTAVGGGGGGGRDINGKNGGSGGGAGGGSGTGGGTATSGQGNAGVSLSGGGGGGGAGAAGSGLNGGNGISYNITGSTVYYGSGGAARSNSQVNGSAGLGGAAVGQNGTNGGGGGGAASFNNTGATGGNGMVIVKYVAPSI